MQVSATVPFTAAGRYSTITLNPHTPNQFPRSKNGKSRHHWGESETKVSRRSRLQPRSRIQPSATTVTSQRPIICLLDIQYLHKPTLLRSSEELPSSVSRPSSPQQRVKPRLASSSQSPQPGLASTTHSRPTRTITSSLTKPLSSFTTGLCWFGNAYP